jgi:hypothetical protein
MTRAERYPVLSAAIGNCLSTSLLFCALKAKVQLGPIRAVVLVGRCDDHENTPK